MEDNIYSKFGYTPTAAVTKTNVANTIKLGGSEKQVLLDTFERKARAYLLPSQTRQVRGRTLNRVATKTRSKSLKHRRSRSRGAENKG
jgi:hypothetical protein